MKRIPWLLASVLLSSTAQARDAEGLAQSFVANDGPAQDLAARHFEDGGRLHREGRHETEGALLSAS